MIDISGLNRQKIDMNEKLLGYKQDLSMISAVQVLQGFSRFDKPAGPSLYVLLAVGLLSFLALAYLYALFSSINAKLKSRKIGTNNG